MGGAFAGAFAAGLANSMQKAQEQKVQEEYRKALVEQSKLNTKVLENKLQREQYEQQMFGSIAQAAGIPVPPMPQVAPVQQAAPQPKQGLLGKLFNPQPQTSPTQAMQPTPQPIPQMVAQAQMQKQISPETKAFATDLIMKKYADMPPWREKHLMESGQVGQKVTVMTPSGPATIILNKRGEPMQSYSQPPEYGTITQQGPMGESYQHFYPKHAPPQGGIMTTPPAQAMQKAPNPEQEKELRDLEGNINSLNGMIGFAKDPKNVDAFGTIAAGKHKLYQDEGALAGAGRVGVELLPKSIGGGEPRPEVSTFLSQKQAFTNKLRNKEFGSALSEREYGEFLKAAISSTTPTQFVAVASGVQKKLTEQYQMINRDIQQPYGMRQKPSLGLGKQEWIENGVKYRINPQTGKKQMWRD